MRGNFLLTTAVCSIVVLGAATAAGSGSATAATPSSETPSTISAQVNSAATVTAASVTVPGRPGRPKATRIGDRRVTLAGTAATANGAKVTSYQVRGSAGVLKTCLSRACTLTGLTNGKTYYFKVRARNAKGYGPYSLLSPGIVPKDIPPTPAAPQVAFVPGAPGGRLAVTWTPPTVAAGKTLRYQLASSDGTVLLGADYAVAYLADLTNGKAYRFRVRAATSSWWSAWSAWSQPGTPAAPPATPAAPTATARTTTSGGAYSVSWVPPAANGATITGYTLRAYQGGGLTRTVYVPGTETAWTVTLPFDGPYDFTLDATNRSGTSYPSLHSAPVQAERVPFPPTGVKVEPRDRGAKVTFDYAGPRADYFRVHAIRPGVGADHWTTVGADGLISELANGIEYVVQVQACNDACGPFSNWSARFTPFGPAYAPSQLALGGTAVGSTTDFAAPVITWCGATTNGRPIDHYELAMDGGSWVTAGEPDPNLPNPTCRRATASWSAFGNHTVSVRAVDSEGVAGTVATAGLTLNKTSLGIKLTPVAATAGCASPCSAVSVVVASEYYPGVPHQTVSINSGARTCDLAPTGSTGALPNGTFTFDSPGCLVTAGDVVTATRTTTLFGQTLTALPVTAS